MLDIPLYCIIGVGEMSSYVSHGSRSQQAHPSAHGSAHPHPNARPVLSHMVSPRRPVSASCLPAKACDIESCSCPVFHRQILFRRYLYITVVAINYRPPDIPARSTSTASSVPVEAVRERLLIGLHPDSSFLNPCGVWTAKNLLRSTPAGLPSSPHLPETVLHCHAGGPQRLCQKLPG